MASGGPSGLGGYGGFHRGLPADKIRPRSEGQLQDLDIASLGRERKKHGSVSLGDFTPVLLHDPQAGTSRSSLGTIGRESMSAHSMEALSEVSEEEEGEESSASEDESGSKSGSSSGPYKRSFALQLHHLHFQDADGNPTGETMFHLGPITLPECRSSAQLARAAEKTLQAEQRIPSMMTFHIEAGQLICCDNAELSIQLRRAEVGIAYHSSKQTAVVAIVPDDKGQDVEQAAGWIFKCFRLRFVMNRLTESGCYFNELQAQYNFIFATPPGRGAFGEVVAGASKATGKTVAIKVFKSKVKREMVLSEAEMLLAAAGPPCIIRFHCAFMDLCDTGKQPRRWSLVFDFHGKGDLYDTVIKGKPLMEPQALHFLHDVLCALIHLGSRGIFHRDVKPENLLVTNSRRIVLADFGMAVFITNSAAMKETVGSIGYSSPEMLTGRNVGCHGDSFGAGVVLYFMMSKSTPFLAPTTELIKERTLAGKVNLSYGCFHHLSEACVQLLLGLLKVDIDERLQPHHALAYPCFKESVVGLTASTEPSLPAWERMSQTSKADASLDRALQSGASFLAQQAKVAPPSEGTLPHYRDRDNFTRRPGS